MPPQIASIVFIIVTAGLFILDRDRDTKTSKALWIPVIWLWLAGSRSVAEWLAAMGWGPPVNAADTYIDGSPADRNVLTVLLVIGLLVLVRRKRFGALLLANGPLLLFFVYAAASAFWSDYPDITIRRWVKDVGDLVMVMVVVTDRDWYAGIKRFLVRPGFLLIPYSVLLIKYYPAIGRAYNRWTWMVTFTGVTTHKNLLGRVALIFGIAFVWCFLVAYRERTTVHRSRHLIAHGAALTLVVWLFVTANSVTAQSCFLLATAFLLAAGSRALGEKRWVVHVLVAVLLALPLATTILGIGGGAIEEMGRDSTLTGRTAIWEQVLAEVQSPLLGTGFESFWLGDRLERIQVIHPGLNESHNGFVEIYITLGWIGVFLLAVIIIMGYRNIIISMRQNPDIGRLRMAYFIAAVVLSFTEAGFRMLNISWITFLMAVVALPENRSREALRNDSTISAPPRRARWESPSAAFSRP
jgi:exopolysaccharide production protein ExoQ